MKYLLATCAMLVIVVACATPSQAAVIVDPGLAPGTLYRLVFVTEGAMAADEENITIYNQFVTTQANLSPELAALNTTWSVIGSSPAVNAKTNTGTDPATSTGLAIYNLGGERVASDNADLWDGQIENAIDVDQYGTVWFGRVVLTGTAPDGTGVVDRQFSGPNSFRVEYGYTDQTGSAWIDANDYQGTLSARQYYAISGVLVASAPEPSSLGMVLLAGGAMIAGRRRARC
ncbi:PEP-CTERM sorting domain-containing protein [Planctomycetales bacterium ZRK34]|nr:PEP-CTERM sorting domain-containing protein [Planctomycetales bacterium ZRK34]